MTEHLPDIGEEQKQQLMAKTLQEGMNAWDYVQSRVQTDQPWVVARILSPDTERVFPYNRPTTCGEARRTTMYRKKNDDETYREAD